MADDDILLTEIIALEKDFGLPSGFLSDLPKESDWSFTIKLHSLLEASLTQALVAEIGEPRLDELVSSMSILGRHSKVTYAEALGILPKLYGDFIKRLTTIRNHLVHRLEALTFTYSAYLAGLSSSERSNTLREILFLAGGPNGKAGELFGDEPRVAVWIHGLAAVTYLAGQRGRAELNTQLRRHYKDAATQILGPIPEF